MFRCSEHANVHDRCAGEKELRGNVDKNVEQFYDVDRD